MTLKVNAPNRPSSVTLTLDFTHSQLSSFVLSAFRPLTVLRSRRFVSDSFISRAALHDAAQLPPHNHETMLLVSRGYLRAFKWG